MTQQSLHWCVKPIKSKHNGDYKRVIYSPNNDFKKGRLVKDVKPFVCLICKKRYSRDEVL